MSFSALPAVQVDFTISVGPGRLEASLPVPVGEVTLTQLLPVLQNLSSQIIGSAISLVEQEGHSISCRAGCGACCRQLVPISIFEAEALAAWIHTLPVELQQALEGRFHATLLKLREQGILARLDPATYTEENTERQVAIDYLAQRVPCPFLVDESCSIHPFRPLSCREYLVTSPPEFCANPSELQVIGVPIPLKLSTVLYKLGGLVERDTRGWIPLVFLFAWMRSGALPGDAITGPGPELLYEVIKRLTTH